MEEVIELLRERNDAISLPLELPSEEQLEHIQEELLISLPHDLRTFLLEVSDVVCGSIEPVTAADPRAHTYLPEVTAVAWDRGLPRHWLPVCEYNGGYACIADEGRVCFWSDGEMTDESWQDIWNWCRDVWLAS